jgi:hypothetical protein
LPVAARADSADRSFSPTNIFALVAMLRRAGILVGFLVDNNTPDSTRSPLNAHALSPQACQYSDVTVREWFSLLCAVWLLSSISSLTPFDRTTTAIRMGLAVGITRACVHVSLRGTGVCEPPGASLPKATAMMWLVRIALPRPKTSVAMTLPLVLQGFRADFPQQGICWLWAIGLS